ncbi:hypothetical protein DUI87_11913 [Hirundo rustica rustica]|uniref:Uncharacterized protein n=1 Tax=Hirundo rustica rustica TaxID=333673 RepID=A0A3M0KXE4_HIRRU|nr:hypothetical protein DUI87_11913 [Hirundo rustica rustica]
MIGDYSQLLLGLPYHIRFPRERMFGCSFAPAFAHLCVIIKSQNDVELEGTFEPTQCHPCHGQDTFHYPRVRQATSSLALDTSRDPGAATAALDNQFWEQNPCNPTFHHHPQDLRNPALEETH